MFNEPFCADLRSGILHAAVLQVQCTVLNSDLNQLVTAGTDRIVPDDPELVEDGHSCEKDVDD